MYHTEGLGTRLARRTDIYLRTPSVTEEIDPKVWGGLQSMVHPIPTRCIPVVHWLPRWGEEDAWTVPSTNQLSLGRRVRGKHVNGYMGVAGWAVTQRKWVCPEVCMVKWLNEWICSHLCSILHEREWLEAYKQGDTQSYPQNMYMLVYCTGVCTYWQHWVSSHLMWRRSLLYSQSWLTPLDTRNTPNTTISWKQCSSRSVTPGWHVHAHAAILS